MPVGKSYKEEKEKGKEEETFKRRTVRRQQERKEMLEHQKISYILILL